MDPSPDDLAGVVDLFGALPPAVLERALSELAFKRGTELADPTAAIRRALEAYALVRYADEGEHLLAVGPTAFPSLPEGAQDLPHILDEPERDPDESAVAAAVERRYREEAALALTVGADQRCSALVEVGYDIGTWPGVDVDAVHDRLLAADD